MFDFSNILEFLSNNTEWINWAAFILVFLESLIIVGLFTPATLIVPGTVSYTHLTLPTTPYG